MYTKFICEKAFDILENGVINNNYDMISYGSLLSGIGFGNCSTTLGHALSYVFSNEGISHGHALAFTTTVAHQFNNSIFYDRFVRMVKKLDFKEITLSQDLTQAYKDLLMKSSQNQFEFTNAYYIPIKNNHVLKFNIQAAGIFGNSVIFKNELYRIGGLKTLRGFDEESIYASGFIIPTLEYRFLFAKNSNLLVFVEGAWYENNSINLYLNDKPVSFGAGINIDTKAGILSLNFKT